MIVLLEKECLWPFQQEYFGVVLYKYAHTISKGHIKSDRKID